MSYEEIPTEILCHILRLLCEKPIAIHALDKTSRFDVFPWAAGQVSRRWREAFLSYPDLWSSLSLEYTYVPSVPADLDDFAEMNRRTILYLERSGQLPLTLTISIPSVPKFRKIKHFPMAAWRSLLSCSDRWKTADLVLANNRRMVDDLLECRNQVSILESMSLDIDPMITECKPQDSAFAVAPRLTELKLRHDGQCNRWVFPWSHLKKLHIEMDNAEAALSQLQNVEEIRLLPPRGLRLARFNPSSPIQLPHLRFFEVWAIHYLRIFEWFEMPLLEHLSVYDHIRPFVFPEGSEWKAEIASLINRSSCRIHSLTVRLCRDGLARDIAETLAASVEHLCIKDPVGETLPPLIRVIANSNGGVFLPNLRELEIICCPGQADEECLAAIFHLLKVRVKPSGLLKRVTVQLKLGARCDWLEECCSNSRIEVVDQVVETVMRGWSFMADISFDKAHSRISIEPHPE